MPALIFWTPVHLLQMAVGMCFVHPQQPFFSMLVIDGAVCSTGHCLLSMPSQCALYARLALQDGISCNDRPAFGHRKADHPEKGLPDGRGQGLTLVCLPMTPNNNKVQDDLTGGAGSFQIRVQFLTKLNKAHSPLGILEIFAYFFIAEIKTVGSEKYRSTNS